MRSPAPKACDITDNAYSLLMTTVMLVVFALSAGILGLGAWAHWEYMTRATLIVWLCMVAMLIACGAFAFMRLM